MALKNFYKTSGGNWVVGKYNNVTPGDFVSEISPEGNIYVYKFGEETDHLVSGLPTSFCDENGDAYETLEAFKTATDGFFVKASGDGGTSAPTAVTYTELAALIGTDGLTAGGKYAMPFQTRHFLTDGLVAQAYDYSAPAITGITITPDAVGTTPTAYFYTVVGLALGEGSVRSAFSAEIETLEGDSTTELILAATVPVNYTSIAIFKGTETGVYTEVSSVGTVGDLFGTFGAEGGLLAIITAIPLASVISATPAEQTGDEETLILTATSVNTFDTVVQSVEYPNDIIHYDWNFLNWIDNVNFVSLGEGTPLISDFKGVITYREDTLQKNKTGFDFRTCLNRMWSIAQAEWVDGTYNEGDFVQVTGDGTVIYKALTGIVEGDSIIDATKWKWIWDITDPYWSHSSMAGVTLSGVYVPILDPSDYEDRMVFDGDYLDYLNNTVEVGVIDLVALGGTGKALIPQVVLIQPENDAIINNTIGKCCYFSTLSASNSNTLSGGSNGNTLSSSSYNTLSGSYGNTLSGGCYSNTLSGGCYSNTLSKGSRNTLSEGSSNNTLSEDSNSNNLSGSNNNTLSGESSYNTLSGGSYDNTLSGGCYSNTLSGTTFVDLEAAINNHFKAGVSGKTSNVYNGDNFADNTHLKATYSCDVIRDNTDINRVVYWDEGVQTAELFDAKVPELLTAATSTDGTTITLTFDSDMIDPAALGAEFTLNVDASPVSKSVALDSNAKVYIITPTVPIAWGETVTLDIATGNIEAVWGEHLLLVEDFAVTNDVAAEIPVLVTAETNEGGTLAILDFDIDMANPAAFASDVVVSVDATPVSITGIALGTDISTIEVTPTVPFVFGDVITISVASGNITGATQGGLLAEITDQEVTNNVPE
jgi:hypothetical protein